MWRFTLFGFPIFVMPIFWFGAALIGTFGMGGFNAVQDLNGLLLLALFIVIIFVSLMVHELGHAFTIRKFGTESVIQLHGMGGLCISQDRYTTRWQNILISAAGPAAGLALAVVFYLVDQFFFLQLMEISPLLAKAVRYGLFINIFWSLFNLLPILPMDGGHILRDALGPRRLRVTYIIGGIGAAILAAVAVLFMQPFIALFLGVLAFQNFRGTPPPGGVETTGNGTARP